MRIPLAEIGRRAAEHVRHLIDGEQSKNGRVEIVPAELIQRATT
jgi:DNA-binding LacI/PurR family transcriptional regulator